MSLLDRVLSRIRGSADPAPIVVSAVPAAAPTPADAPARSAGAAIPAPDRTRAWRTVVPLAVAVAPPGGLSLAASTRFTRSLPSRQADLALDAGLGRSAASLRSVVDPLPPLAAAAAPALERRPVARLAHRRPPLPAGRPGIDRVQSDHDGREFTSDDASGGDIDDDPPADGPSSPDHPGLGPDPGTVYRSPATDDKLIAIETAPDRSDTSGGDGPVGLDAILDRRGAGGDTGRTGPNLVADRHAAGHTTGAGPGTMQRAAGPMLPVPTSTPTPPAATVERIEPDVTVILPQPAGPTAGTATGPMPIRQPVPSTTADRSPAAALEPLAADHRGDTRRSGGVVPVSWAPTTDRSPLDDSAPSGDEPAPVAPSGPAAGPPVSAPAFTSTEALDAGPAIRSADPPSDGATGSPAPAARRPAPAPAPAPRPVVARQAMAEAAGRSGYDGIPAPVAMPPIVAPLAVPVTPPAALFTPPAIPVRPQAASPVGESTPAYDRPGVPPPTRPIVSVAPPIIATPAVARERAAIGIARLQPSTGIEPAVGVQSGPRNDDGPPPWAVEPADASPADPSEGGDDGGPVADTVRPGPGPAPAADYRPPPVPIGAPATVDRHPAARTARVGDTPPGGIGAGGPDSGWSTPGRHPVALGMPRFTSPGPDRAGEGDDDRRYRQLSPDPGAVDPLRAPDSWPRPGDTAVARVASAAWPIGPPHAGTAVPPMVAAPDRWGDPADPGAVQALGGGRPDGYDRAAAETGDAGGTGATAAPVPSPVGGSATPASAGGQGAAAARTLERELRHHLLLERERRGWGWR